MLNPKPIYRTAQFWRRIVPGILFIIWLVFFWHEVYLCLVFFANGLQPPSDPIEAENTIRAFLALMLSAAAFGVYFLISIWFVSQFVLPVQTPAERRMIFERLVRYLSAAHGAAVFIREGQVVGSVAELQSSLPGVAFVDTKSAIVLERQPFISRPGGKVGRRGFFRNRVLQSVEDVVEGQHQPSNALARAAGPGLVFTHAGERIRGSVSLRNHLRVQLNTRSLTRDGFEVAAAIVAIFSLGEPPEVIRVGYAPAKPGDPEPFKPENLRAIRIDAKTGKIKNFVDELDLQDQREVHTFAQRAQPQPTPMATKRAGKNKQQHMPFLFDPERVFRAIYSDARRTQDDGVESWVDLPLRVAVEAFHNAIATVRYTDLYLPEESRDFPLIQTFRPNFSRVVRNQGVLSFQFVRRKNGQPFQAGDDWNEADLDIFPAQPLRSPKVLRDRGIRVIAASFSELLPTNPAVRQKLLNYWRSKRSREADLARVPYDVEEIKTRARARALAQRDIVFTLQKILEDSSITPETMAFQVMQALEQFAKDPATEQLLPQEALGMVNQLHDWIWGTRASQNLTADENFQPLFDRYPQLNSDSRAGPDSASEADEEDK